MGKLGLPRSPTRLIEPAASTGITGRSDLLPCKVGGSPRETRPASDTASTNTQRDDEIKHEKLHRGVRHPADAFH